MKKTLLFTLIICTGLLSSCKSEKKVKNQPILLPTDVISLDTACQNYAGDGYTFIMKDDAVKQEGNHLYATYLAEPLGAGDNIYVDIYITDENNNSSSIKNTFEASKNKRSDFVAVEDLNAEAYITYPTIHLYSNDVYAAITAGSGSDDEQAELLINLGKTALENIEAYASSK